MKDADLIEQLVKSLSNDYPELSRTVLEERDLYLARSIWEVCGLRSEPDNQELSPAVPSEDATGEADKLMSIRQRTRETPVQVPSTAQMSCCSVWPSMDLLPRVVVAVVGIGHVAGIKKAWSQASSIDKRELCRVKPTPRSWIVFRWLSRALLLAVVGFATYFVTYNTFRVCRYFVRGLAGLFWSYAYA